MKRKIWVLIGIVALLFTNRAYAKLCTDLKISSFPVENLAVISGDGFNYTKNVSGQSTISAVVDVHIEAGLLGEIHNWSTWLYTNPVAVPGATDFDHKGSGYIKVYEDDGLGYVNEVIQSVEIEADYSFRAVNDCNKLADDLRNQGYTNDEIFSEDHTILIDVTPKLDYSIEYDYAGLHGLPGKRVVELTCMAMALEIDDSGPTRTPRDAHVISVTLDMLHEDEPTSCPSKVTAYVTYVADTEGIFSSRFRSVFGQVSAPIELEMEESDRQGDLYIKTYQQKFMVGEVPDPIREKPGKPVSKYDSPDELFAPDAGHNPEGDVEPIDKGGIQSDLDELYTEQADSNVHEDSLWVEILSASSDSIDKSDYANYKVTCRPEGGIDPAKSDELTFGDGDNGRNTSGTTLFLP